MVSRVVILVAFVALATSNIYAVGALFVRPLNSNTDYVAMNIRFYDAKVQIDGHVATTTVEQTVHNGLNSLVESTFIFPLPAGAMITDMSYEFNGQWYVANVRERQEAQRAYDSKVRRVLDPALLQEIGDNLFKLNIAPINPNSDVRFRISYTEIMDYAVGTLTYTHMLNATKLSPKPLERVSLEIMANNANGIKEVWTPTYGSMTANMVKKLDDTQYSATWGDENYVPTKDYVFKIRIQRQGTEINTLTYVPNEKDSMGTSPFFITFVTPPDSNAIEQPRTMVVTADVSSSMEGTRIDKLRSALHEFLLSLRAGDKFNIITFSTNVATFENDVVDATPSNIQRAQKFIQGITAKGLTNISDALKKSLEMTYADNMTKICVFLTDGEPSWGETREQAIVDSSKTWNRNNVHIYPIGIGLTTYTLLNKIAAGSAGFVTQITDDDSINVLVADHVRRISLPSILAPALNYGDLAVKDVLPAELPNVSVGDRLMQFGRYDGGGLKPVTLTGVLGGEQVSVTRQIMFGDMTKNNRAVARLWAKQKINALLEDIERVGELAELKNAIIDLSKRFNILTKYTALYADPTEPQPTDAPTEGERPLELVNVSIAPNVVSDATTISIKLSDAVERNIHVEIFDVRGVSVGVLYTGRISERLSFSWNATINDIRLAAGMYRLVVRTSGQVFTTPLMIQ